MRYLRSRMSGGTYFFTVNLANRQSALLVRHIDMLRDCIRKARNNHPFTILAMVVLPEHLHAIWEMPPGDADFPMRWSQIKAGFPAVYLKMNIFVPAESPRGNEGSGSAGIGNTRSGMKPT